jgi:hypothetical protein
MKRRCKECAKDARGQAALKPGPMVYVCKSHGKSVCVECDYGLHD